MPITAIPVAVDLPATGGTAFVRVPPAGVGGAFTVTGVEVWFGATTSSTISVVVDVLKYSNAGTPALNGTIAASIGGTADHWAVGVPKRPTVSAANAKVSAGEYVAIKTTAQGGGTVTYPAQALLLLTPGATAA